MRISSPAFTSILTGFSLRTRAVPRARGSDRHGCDPRLAGPGRVGRADGGADGQSGKNESAGQGGGDQRKTIGGEHLRSSILALPPDHPAVIPKLKHVLCHQEKMAEMLEI